MRRLALAAFTCAFVAVLALPSPALADQPEGSWQKHDNGWQRVDTSGSVVTGWYEVEGSWFWSDSQGTMATGWTQLPDGLWHWFGTSGAHRRNSWLLNANTWYYLGTDGAMLTGWQFIHGNWYLFSKSGAMLTGWQHSAGRWYYLDENGRMATGWHELNGTWYYFSPQNGAMLTGWVLDDSSWYYLDTDGAMLRDGWLLYQNSWCYLLSNGAAATGWMSLGDKSYFFNDNGFMLSNCWIDDCYLGNDGAMLVSTIAPNGEQVGADGVRVVVDPAPYLSVPYHYEKHGDLPVWQLGDWNASRAIYYLHGGSFDCGINAITWQFIDEVAKASGASVYVAAYPLAPFATYETAYNQVLPSLRGVLGRFGTENVTLLGDSAGGGFAAGIVEWMEQMGETPPAGLALVSPWLDVTCSTSAMFAAEAQGWPRAALEWEGWRWAGDAAWESATSNVRLCPLYGSISQVKRSAVVWGSIEPFAEDAARFASKLTLSGVSVIPVVGQGLDHDWALVDGPQRPEALAAIAQVVNG